MYLKCVNCPKLGAACDGPNFLAMTPQQLITWCKERKKYLGYTNAKIAELSGMSPGTVDSLLANKHPDFKFGTIAPMLQALIGGDWSGEPCPSASDSGEEEKLREWIKRLEKDIEWRDEKIALLNQDSADLRKLIENTNARHTKSQDFLRDQIRYRNKAIAIMGALLGLSLAVIIGALIVDYLNRHIGFIWLDELARILQTDGRHLPDWIA